MGLWCIGGCGMGQQTATIIIESRALMREALISLMVSFSLGVTGSGASAADMGNVGMAQVPGLVIFGALPPKEVAATAGKARKLWPKAKLVFLFEQASPGD